MLKPKPPMILFLDESGHPDLTKVNPQYPVFCLGGIIVDELYYGSEVIVTVNEFKQGIFDNTNVILHSYEIKKQKGDFRCLRNRDIQDSFFLKLNAALSELDYKIISVFIDKAAHKEKYSNPFCPYELSIEILIERFTKLLYRLNRVGYVIAESRGKNEDYLIQKAFDSTLLSGTRYVTSDSIRNKVKGFTFRKKQENIVGLQMSDLCVAAIASAELNQNYSRKDYQTIKGKLDTWHGVKKLP